MKKNSKRLLAAVIALMMVLGMVVPAMATGTDPEQTAASGTKVQITKTLKIGQGITVPDETFKFEFVPVTEAEAVELGETGSYIVPNATQAGASEYPALNNLTVAYSSATRDPDGTDEELTFMTGKLDLAGSGLNWGVPGKYIYSVKEVTGTVGGMTYDDTKYFLKVLVKNDGTQTKVDSVAVFGKDDNNAWVKIDGAPNDAAEPGTSGTDDGCNDLLGNDFRFVNTYKTLVTQHPTNENPTSEDNPNLPSNPGAFKLTKDVSGDFANPQYGFDFKVTIQLPESFSEYGGIAAKVNGYTANIIENVDAHGISDLVDVTLQAGTEYDIYLHHGDSFVINELPAGTIVNVVEQASNMLYVPTYKGKWGGNKDLNHTGSASKGAALVSDPVVVGENGGFVQFTNTLNNSDVTPTGIAISNLPYILMVVIAMAGIGFFMVSKKRRNG